MPQFDPEEWMALAVSRRVNRAMLVPTMLKRVMDHPRFGEYDLSSLDVITYGAAPMPLPVIRDAIAKFPGTRFINAFGQTETASTITMLPPDDHVLDGTPEEVETKLRRLTSIGKPLDDVEVMIVSEDGEPMPDGEVGEIVARGPRMMTGYWQQDEATGDTIRSGWLYTGDLAWQDEDGYIYLAGRAPRFHQARRRDDFAGGSGANAGRASGGCGGGGDWRSGFGMGRRSAGGGGACERDGERGRADGVLPPHGWPGSNGRARWCSWTSCRAT